MKKKFKVFHYLNQFYGGIGGEEKVNEQISFINKPVGLGYELEKLMGNEFEIVLTAVCGDEYFNDNQSHVVEAISKKVEEKEIDLIIAGPAFNAGRYGVACGAICNALVNKLRIIAVTAMYPENPAVDMYRQNERTYIIPSGDTARKMEETMEKMTSLSKKLFGGKVIGSAKEEGYIARGIRKLVYREKNGAERGLDMLEARLRGEVYESELTFPAFDVVAAPTPIKDLSKCKIAFITTAGVVPKGNPDRIKALNETTWAAYPLQILENKMHDCVHGGINPNFIKQRAEYVVPNHTAKKFKEQGIIGSIYENYFVTVGCGGVINSFKKIGSEIAQELIREKVDAVILTST